MEQKEDNKSNYDKDKKKTLTNIPWFVKRQLRTMLGLTTSIRLGLTKGLTKSNLVEMTKEQRKDALDKRFMVRVPDDFTTLEEAVNTVNEYNNLTTVVLMEGRHEIDPNMCKDNSVSIPSTMNIVGDPNVHKEKIKVVGSFFIGEQVEGKFHLQNMTICKGYWAGVTVESSDLTMEDVIVEDCDKGIALYNTGTVVRCINVEVRRCDVGIEVEDGGSIILVGPNMKVHHNNDGLESYYGASVQLVSPLKKEQVFINNKNGDNMQLRF